MARLRRGEIVEVEAGPWDADAFSRCATDGGTDLRVRDVIPGERLLVEVEHVSKGGPVAWGSAKGFVLASPARREPPCLIHGRCGACGIQHVKDADQLAIKVAGSLGAMPEALRDVLRPSEEWVGSPRAEGYRHKAVWRPYVRDERYLLGAYARGSHDIISLAACGVVASPLLEAHRVAVEVLGGLGRIFHPPDEAVTAGGLLRTIVARASREGDVLLTLVARQDHPAFEDAAHRLLKAGSAVAGVHLQIHPQQGDAVTSAAPVKRLTGRSWIEESIAGRPFRVLPLGFFQVNPDVLEGVVAWMRPHLASRARVLDLYCGGGVLGLAATDEPTAVVGVDTSDDGLVAARRDAERHGRTAETTFLAGRPAEAIPEGPFDAAIVDPPRAGLKTADLDALVAAAPERLVYMSCHGPSLGRDAAKLIEAGYTPTALVAADMFPQTPHVEWVAVFDR